VSGNRRQGLVLAALGVALFAAPRASEAQPVATANTEQARTLFHQGVALADQDRWAEALVAFRQSLGLVPRASTRFNLARALLRLGRMREAIEVFDVYTAEAQGPAEAERRSEAVRLRAEAEGALATLRLTGLPVAAEVSIDGAVEAGQGSPRTLRIDPGQHRIEVRDAAGHVERFTVTASAAQVSAQHLQWPDAAPVAAERFGAGGPGELPPVTVQPPPPGRRSLASNPWLWVGIGSVAVGAAAVLLYVFRPAEDPYPGSTNTVIQGATGLTF